MSDSPSAAQRIAFIDALRGFALFGVFGANLMIFSGIIFMNEAQKALVMSGAADRIADRLYLFFIETKFIGLFSILFGISFWLFLDRVGARGGRNAIALFYRRIFWLFVIGAIHGWLMWFMDILRFYAFWAVLLPLFVRMPVKRLLAVAFTFAVVAPAAVAAAVKMMAIPSQGAFYDALAFDAFSSGAYADVLIANWRYDWYFTFALGPWGYQFAVFGRLLLGLCIARAVDLGNLEAYRPILKRLVIAGALVGAVGNSILVSPESANVSRPSTVFLNRAVIESGYLGFSLAYASALALLFLSVRWKRAVLALAPVGQMALSWYLLQTVFGIWLFYGFVPGGPHLMGKVGPVALAVIWIAGFALQIAVAHMWLRRFRFGPAEWVWRTLTYSEPQPWRKCSST